MNERESLDGRLAAVGAPAVLVTNPAPERNRVSPRQTGPRLEEELFPTGLSPEALARWASESDFFDQMAEKQRPQPLDALTLERYRAPRRPWFNKEFRFRLMGELSGRRVLDVGCGDGSNALLMARFGARVTGIDISPRSIELCKHRARLDGVEDSTHFICSPLETADLLEGSFDVIWGDGVLHHLIPELEGVMRKLVSYAKPGGLLVFSEPVCLSPLMRKLRKHIPIHTDATPNERPLERTELDIIQRHLPGLELRWFSFLSRMDRLFLRDHNFERASKPRKLAADVLGCTDRALLALPGLQRLGGMCVMYGRLPGQD
ncbi:class I SAM-dependent methyltransferase [Vitiosangium sp. GDMCC 1.1324]|uniref:class I SAM-dependent methyltransferase n=1 Tax=Vitiosangium sp. (strain GDMCC 1.1324) TaxID=2138576 RepID=UPI000D3DA91D|nr:class I SAM-dependent methyltransferase [Vitiosangium sp. GDMCC 1.1324]PTL82432.1 class I SAM-dependent methyltransferase [Vitiosangium sp. GDMCC 1.1324]